MNGASKRWLHLALCLLPGAALALILGIGAVAGEGAGGAALGGPFGLGLLALAFLACPLGMALMTRRTTGNPVSTEPVGEATCCLPGQQVASGSSRLGALRAEREALEREVAGLQQGRGMS